MKDIVCKIISMKKSTIIILVILVLIISVVLVVVVPWLKERKKDPYATMLKPRVEAMAMMIKEMNMEKTTMDMNILIRTLEVAGDRPVGGAPKLSAGPVGIEALRAFTGTWGRLSP